MLRPAHAISIAATLFVAFLTGAGPLRAATLDDALAALGNGDFAAAAAALVPLAEAGDVAAQRHLARLHLHGEQGRAESIRGGNGVGVAEDIANLRGRQSAEKTYITGL